jgi:nickel/cobalt transporter (NicO) family protein
MRKLTLLAGLAVAAILAVTWFMGGFDWLAYHAVSVQREFQDALAGAVRRLKAGDRAALLWLVTLCFGYGVVHAAGPGHGKMLVGSYTLSNRVRTRRIVAMTLAASLAQALTAVLLVYAGVLVFSWTMKRMVGMAERSLTAASYAAIGAIGLYLAWRGVRLLFAAPAVGHDLRHDHDHDQEEHCDQCHGPSIESMERVHSLRDALIVIAGVAVRPCTGAILLLILCWRIGANVAGIAGAFAMGLGTAVVTVTAALLAATMREGAWATGLDTLAMRRVMGGAGLLAGSVLIGTSALMLRSFL